MDKEYNLFWGEFVVRQDGIYTYVHYYKHPETKRCVIFVGMNHGGDKEYFEAVAKILEDAEIVLYEGLPPDQEETSDEIQETAEEDLTDLYRGSIDATFYPAMRTYFQRASEYLQLVDETDAFDYSQPGWESGDAEFFTQLKDEEKQQALEAECQNALCRLTRDRKKEVVNFIRNAVKSMEEGRFTRKDFGDGFIFLWSDQVLVDLMCTAIGKPRDEMMMERFDKIIQARSPRVIGIKFGAAHIAYQRKLLEQRGYVLQQSVALRNIAF